MRRVMIVLLALSAAEALLLPVQRLSAGAVTPRMVTPRMVTPRIAASSTMQLDHGQLDVIPLCDSTSPGFIASRFVVPAVGGSVLAGLVRRPVTKLVVGVAALLSVLVLHGGARLALPDERGPGGGRLTLIEKLPDRFAHLPSLPVGNRNLAVILGSAGIGLAARCLLL